MHKAFRSRLLETDRDILVYLPPGYRQETERRYPVLYLQDGQNLFDGATSYVAGEEWCVDETAEGLIRDGEIEPLIIVGIYNTGERRIDEYTPTYDPLYNAGGKAGVYGRLIVEELKTIIDASYRTLPGAEFTGIGGSSLGGLVSLYVALAHPTVFGRAAILSPAVWWHKHHLVQYALQMEQKPPLRIWLDMGTKEGADALRGVRLLRDALLVKGWSLDSDLRYFEAQNATHNERAWQRRFDAVLRYLYPLTE